MCAQEGAVKNKHSSRDLRKPCHAQGAGCCLRQFHLCSPAGRHLLRDLASVKELRRRAESIRGPCGEHTSCDCCHALLFRTLRWAG